VNRCIIMFGRLLYMYSYSIVSHGPVAI